MNETLTYWEPNGVFLSKEEIDTDNRVFYVKHDDKTVTVKDPAYWGNSATQTFYRNFEDAKRDLIEDLDNQVLKLLIRIEEIKSWKEI
jgi:hypothetical protein